MMTWYLPRYSHYLLLRGGAESVPAADSRREGEGRTWPIDGVRIIDWCGACWASFPNAEFPSADRTSSKPLHDLMDCFLVLDRPVDKGKEARARLPPIIGRCGGSYWTARAPPLDSSRPCQLPPRHHICHQAKIAPTPSQSPGV